MNEFLVFEQFLISQGGLLAGVHVRVNDAPGTAKFCSLVQSGQTFLRKMHGVYPTWVSIEKL